MMPTHELWRSILECGDRNQLSSGAWKSLYAVAKRIDKEDFSVGDSSVLGNKLIRALGYNGWKELKEESKLQSKIDSLNHCIRLAKKKYNGSLSKLFAEEGTSLVDSHASRLGGLRKFYRILKSLGISRKDVGDDVLSLEKILFDRHLDSGTALEKFREEKRKHTAKIRIKAQLKKREPIKSQDK